MGYPGIPDRYAYLRWYRAAMQSRWLIDMEEVKGNLTPDEHHGLAGYEQIHCANLLSELFTYCVKPTDPDYGIWMAKVNKVADTYDTTKIRCCA